jgi:hypothetical protein
MNQFTTDLFSVTYPAGWTAIEHQDGSGAILANSDVGLDRYRQGARFASRDQALHISLTPAELFQALLMPIEPGASAEQLSEALLANLGEMNGAEAGAPQIVALENGRQAALRKAANDCAEGAVILFELAEGIIALNTVAASPGEYKEAEATALAILSSLTFIGTAGALTAAIDPVPPLDMPIQ